jgi:hypothetical protein
MFYVKYQQDVVDKSDRSKCINIEMQLQKSIRLDFKSSLQYVDGYFL